MFVESSGVAARGREEGRGSLQTICECIEQQHSMLDCHTSQEITATLKRDYEAAKKDNNFIYNDRVPNFSTLEPPGKAAIAKPIQFQSPSPNFIDIFAHLVPLPVSKALTTYNNRKDSIVNEELEKLRQATSALNE